MSIAKCIEGTRFKIEDNPISVAKFLVNEYEKLLEESKQFGENELSMQGIEDIKNFIKSSEVDSKDTKPSILNENKTETYFMSPEEASLSDMDGYALDYEEEEDVPEVTNTVTEFTFFDGQNKLEYSIKEVIDNILKNYTSFSKEGKEVIEKLKILSTKIDKGKVVISKKALKVTEKSHMNYVTKLQTIRIFLDALNAFGIDYAVEAFLHEVTHHVTINSYMNPVTMEDRMFKDLIDENYNAFKSQAIDKTDYGFKDELEFIAEIFSNNEFQVKLKKLEKEKKSSFWKDLIDAVRRLFGFKKTSVVDKIITSIIEIANENEWESSGLTVERTIDPSKVKNQYQTLSDKLDNAIESSLLSIEENINKLNYLIQRIKNEDTVKSMQDYLNALQILASEIESYSYIDKIKGIESYVAFMNKSLASLEYRINKVDTDDIEEVREAARMYSDYLMSYSVANKFISLLSDIRQDSTQTIATKKDINDLEKSLIIATGKYNYLSSRLDSMKKETVKSFLNDIKYFPQVEKKHRERLAKEHKESNIPTNKDTWIATMMVTRDKDLVQQSLNEAITEVTDGVAFDISGNDVLLNTSTSVSAPLIQILNQMLIEIDNKRIKTEREKDQEFKAAFEELVKEKGTNSLNKLYENILTFDNEGKAYLNAGIDGKFMSEYVQGRKDLEKEYGDKDTAQRLIVKGIADTLGTKSDEYKAALKEVTKIKNQLKAARIKLDNKAFKKNAKGAVIGVNDEYISKVKLTPTEQKVRDLFVEVIETSDKNTYSKDSLITFIRKVQGEEWVKFHELPKVTKSDIERLWQGNIKGIVTEKWTDLTEVRPDDVGYIEKNIDGNNKEIKRLRIHYRDRKGTFKNSDQSIDLFTIMRLEYKNGNMFAIRRNLELDLNFLVDISKSKEYYKRQGTRKIFNVRSEKLQTFSGDQSNTHKMMVNMMENRFYDIMVKAGTTIGKVDLNKAVGFINGASAFLTLSLNIASGTANVVNANAQMFLESFIKGRYIKAEGIKKANLKYAQHLSTSIADIKNPINNSYVNQVVELFNARGIFNLSHSSFLQSDMIKKGLSLESLQVFQESGEHWIQGVIVMAVLDGVKAMNEKYEFIDTEGNVVKSEKEAASLLDMLKPNEAGFVEMDPRVIYTTHSRITKWDEGGKEKTDMLIRKKLHDSIGNYTEIDQPEYSRHWSGKLVGLYRKYFIPMGISRLRGIQYVARDRDELTDDEKTFSYALQEDEEGTYTTFVRYVISSIRNKQFYLLSKGSEWNRLSEYEKHNIKRALVEFILSFVMLPLSYKFIAAGRDGDDEYAFFLAYQLRRLDTELSQYYHPGELFKLMRSPIPSARLLETAGNIFAGALSPWTWDDVYVSGINKGQSKLLVKIQKQIPVVKEFKRTYEDLYSYQNANFGGGF